MTADSWDAYIGTDPSLPFEQIEKAYATEQYSGFNARYTDYPSGEPVVRLGYAEQNFILAEAAVRGWISGDAITYYKKGNQSSHKFIAANTANEESVSSWTSVRRRKRLRLFLKHRLYS